MRISKPLFWPLLLLPWLAHAAESEKSQFIGTWCSNPCLYGTVSRPWNLPCGFEITESEIRWEHYIRWDDRSKTKKFALKYKLLEKKEKEEVLLVDGGGKEEWYANESAPDAKHKIILSANHPNTSWSDSVKLEDQRYCEKEKKWCGGGSMFVTRKEGSCP